MEILLVSVTKDDSMYFKQLFNQMGYELDTVIMSKPLKIRNRHLFTIITLRWKFGLQIKNWIRKFSYKNYNPCIEINRYLIILITFDNETENLCNKKYLKYIKKHVWIFSTCRDFSSKQIRTLDSLLREDSIIRLNQKKITSII